MFKSLRPRKNPKSAFQEKLLGTLDYMDGGYIGGWAGAKAENKAIELNVFVNDRFVKKISTKGHRQDLTAIGFPQDNNCGFRELLNVYPFIQDDEHEDKVKVYFDVNGKELSGSPLVLPKPDVIYHIDKIDDFYIHGWLYDKNYTSIDIEVDVYVNGNYVSKFSASSFRKDLVDAGHPKEKCGFHFKYHDYIDKSCFSRIDFYISNTKIKINKKPILIQPSYARLDALRELSSLLRKNPESFSEISKLEWLSRDFIPSVIEKIRSGKDSELKNSYTGRHIFSGLKQPEFIDVIVPVYEGFEETVNCIQSVLSSRNRVKYNLIVIFDKSPNNKLLRYLQKHAAEKKYQLIQNEENLGFVKTVNKGMSLSDTNDVVLLNSDTVVPDGWLDQLSSAAYKDISTGTVTPFSNNATICSYPNFCLDNPSPSDVNVQNKLFNEINAGQTLDLPTAHGFCMYIKRATLKEVGLFDCEKWGKGYAEENDFSLRAETLGWRNVMALDTFVTHLGSVSFANDSNEFINKNLKVLNKIYPEYATAVQRFVEKDPVRPFRNKVSLAEIKDITKTKKGSFLLVSLTFGGGTKIATDAIASELEKCGYTVFYLTVPKEGSWRLSLFNTNLFVDYDVNTELNSLYGNLKLLNIKHINYHHSIEFDTSIWDLPQKIGVKYDVTLHDYLFICPRVNLIDETNVYCGEPPVYSCNNCISSNGCHPGLNEDLISIAKDVDSWRAHNHKILKEARMVIVPNVDMSTRMSKYFPDVEFKVKPHPEAQKYINIKDIGNNALNIAVIGAIGIHKGYERLYQAAKYADKFDLPLFFHVFGYTKNDDLFVGLKNVKIHGKYKQEELSSLLAQEDCDIAALLSVWPETYSYTFSEAVSAGLQVLSYNIGAVPERVKEIDLPHELIDLHSSPEKLCATLLSFQGRKGNTIQHGNEYNNFVHDYYGIFL